MAIVDWPSRGRDPTIPADLGPDTDKAADAMNLGERLYVNVWPRLVL